MIKNALLFHNEKIGYYVILLPEGLIRENEESFRSWCLEEIHMASERGVGLILFKTFGTIRDIGSNLEKHFSPLKIEVADTFYGSSLNQPLSSLLQ